MGLLNINTNAKIDFRELTRYGGEGSGNFDHCGVPGQQGGSGDCSMASDKVSQEDLKDTKVLDENGNPLVVWHGTPVMEDFEEFDLTLPPAHRKSEDIGGIYWHADPRYAHNYKGRFGRMIKANLVMKNPLNITADFLKYMKKERHFMKAKNKALEKLDKTVHDGVILDKTQWGPAEYVVFSNKQVVRIRKPVQTNIVFEKK